jgi:hypothetical protein
MTGTLSPHHRPIAARSGAITGGLTPFAAATSMAGPTAADLGLLAISVYLIVLAVIMFNSTMATPETTGKELK